MGKVKHLAIIRNFLKKTPVINISSIKKLIGENNKYIHLLIHNLVKKKEIFRLTKGFYSKTEDPTLVVFCFKPSYIGLQEAISVHNLWQQETNTIIITTKSVREGIRSVMEKKVLLKKIPPNLFFGVEYSLYGGIYVPVSDIEKTFLDMIYFNQPLDKELYKVFKKRINRKKLNTYLKKYNLKVKNKVYELINKRIL